MTLFSSNNINLDNVNLYQNVILSGQQGKLNLRCNLICLFFCQICLLVFLKLQEVIFNLEKSGFDQITDNLLTGEKIWGIFLPWCWRKLSNGLSLFYKDIYAWVNPYHYVYVTLHKSVEPKTWFWVTQSFKIFQEFILSKIK